MKIEQLLVQHFYLTKQVTLQGIGTFTLSPDFIMPLDSDKDIVLPENAVSFQYNPKATEDESLITYIVQQTRKIRPLASADLESYLMLASQFLNIGKPFKIDGIGMLEKNQLGEYQFSQGQFINTKTEQAQVQLREKADDDISFSNKRTVSDNSGNNKKVLLIVAALVIIGAVAFAAWYFLTKKKTAEPVAETPTEQVTPAVTPPAADTTHSDTTKPVQPKIDSTNLQALKPAVNNDGYTFKIVFKVTTNKVEALDKLNTLTLRKHKVIMYTADSVTYKLAEPFNLPLTDTAKIKDSLNKYYYAGKANVELK